MNNQEALKVLIQVAEGHLVKLDVALSVEYLDRETYGGMVNWINRVQEAIEMLKKD